MDQMVGLFVIVENVQWMLILLLGKFSCQIYLGYVWQHLFSEYKIFSSANIFGKGKYFLVFGCILKIVLKNIFKCLVTF